MNTKNLNFIHSICLATDSARSLSPLLPPRGYYIARIIVARQAPHVLPTTTTTHKYDVDKHMSSQT